MKVSTIILFSIFLLTIVEDVNAHSLFNSETHRIAGYKIQIATDPEIPAENEHSKIMLAISGSNDEYIAEVILSLRLIQGESVVYEFGPRLIQGGHLDIDYVFERSGQYIAEVKIYENDRVIETKFNIGVTRTISMIFISLIIVSVFAPVGLILGIKLSKKR